MYEKLYEHHSQVRHSKENQNDARCLTCKKMKLSNKYWHKFNSFVCIIKVIMWHQKKTLEFSLSQGMLVCKPSFHMQTLQLSEMLDTI